MKLYHAGDRIVSRQHKSGEIHVDVAGHKVLIGRVIRKDGRGGGQGGRRKPDLQGHALVDAVRELLGRRLASLTSQTQFSPEALAEVVSRTANAFSLFPFWSQDEQRQFLRAQNPVFWIGEGGITRFALPSGLNMSHHTGRGRPFLTPPKATTFDVRPPFRLR